MPRLPPVEKSPHTRLRLTLMPGVGYSVVTFDQSHSSSSATIWARPVSVPCPISERTILITTVSSGRMTTQAFTSGALPCARTTLLPKGRFKPRASPPPTVAVPTRKERRSIFRVLEIMAAPLCLGRGVDGLARLLEGAAAADVGDPRVDVGVGRPGLVLQERRHRHDHARLTVAALGYLVFEPGLLNLVPDSVGREALDGGDLLALGGADGHDARPDRDAVEVHRAGAALRNPAPVLRARETDLFPDHPQQRCAGIDVDFHGFTVDCQACHRHPSSESRDRTIRLRAPKGNR